MNLLWINAQVICKNDGKGHCDEWTEKEADLAATPLVIFCFVCARLDIPVFLPNFGGTQACNKFYTAFTRVSQTFIDYNEYHAEFHAHIFTEKNGTHLSNLNFRRTQVWDELSMQVNHNHIKLSKTKHSLEQFFLSAVAPSYERRGIDFVDRVDLFESLIKDNKGALFVQSCCDYDQKWFLDLVAERVLICRRAGMESCATDEGMDCGVHYSNHLGRDTMLLSDRGMEYAMVSNATDEGMDRGVHNSDRIGRYTISLSDRGSAGGFVGCATDEGMERRVYYSDRLGRDTMPLSDRGKKNRGKAIMGNGLYYLLQEFNYNDRLVNRAKDRYTESISSITIWFVSKNIASGYRSDSAVATKINAANLNENKQMFLYTKKKNDNRRWKLTRVRNVPDGVKPLDNEEIWEQYEIIHRNKKTK